MKTLWSFCVSMLFSSLASGFLVFALASQKAPFVKAGVAALSLSFLVAFIHFTYPQHRLAHRLTTALNIAAAALFAAAAVLWLLR